MFKSFQKKHKHHSYFDKDDVNQDSTSSKSLHSLGSKSSKKSEDVDYHYNYSGNKKGVKESSYLKNSQEDDDKGYKKVKQPSYKKSVYQTMVLKEEFHCEACVKKVRQALAAIDGVESISVDTKRKRVTVSGYVDPMVVLKKVSKAGKAVELVSSSSSSHKDTPPPASFNMLQSSTPYTYPYRSSSSEQHSNLSRYDSFNDAPPRVIMPPTFLSEEDPNACSIM